MILSAVGVTISGLSTWDHVRFRVSNGTAAGACAALVDSGCKAAHSSAVAEILGVPISHFGSAFYLAIAGIALAAVTSGKQRDTARATTASAALMVTLMGAGAVAYSIFLARELLRSAEACPLCMALYGVNVALLVQGVFWWLRGQRRIGLRSLLVPTVVASTVGGGAFAVTAPFLVSALADTEAVAATATPAVTNRPPLVLPDRIPSQGAPTAEDDLVEFSDLECPFCGVLDRTVASLYEERGPSGLRVRFVNYPLDRACNPHVGRSLHPTACLSARGGICAQEQGRFWPFAEATFALQGTRSRAVVLDTARKVGLDVETFTACLEAPTTVKALDQDIALAHAAGVSATPTIMVNGRSFKGALARAELVRVLADTTSCGAGRLLPDGACGNEDGTR